MKKKVLLMIIGLCLLAFVGGCKKEETDPFGAPVKKDYKASKYVTLGEYKGIEVTVKQFEVTDEVLDSLIQDDLKANATTKEVTDRPVQNGDVVNIDFEGLKDGMAFDGGTAQGYDLEIGSGSFIPGFEEGLIGANKGDKLELNLTFPENYSNEDLAGQAVVFKVTINSISEYVVPELTDEYVAKNTDFDTVEEYKEAKRKSLQSYSDQYNEYLKSNSVMQKVIDNAKISSIPENLLDYYKYVYGNYYEQMIYSNYQKSLADYLTESGKTQEEYEEELLPAAESLAKREMVDMAVAEAEGMTITEEEYQELLPDYLSMYGFDSEETLRKYETKKRTKEQMLITKVEDFLVDQAVIINQPDDSEVTPAPTQTP